MPSNTALISGPAVGAAQIQIQSYSSVFLPPMSTASELVHFLLLELLMAFNIFNTLRVYIVDCVDLIVACTAGGKVLGLIP